MDVTLESVIYFIWSLLYNIGMIALFDLILYAQVNNFSVMSERSSCVEPVLSRDFNASCSRTQYSATG